ncbi:hypothetical protein [Rhodoferax fermentans]|uniref:Transmembrane protein n=1 Tax=Rhodoferax fermentans TaxID=28066 RepID=A0A1T1AYA6_RHOFE|nr:hypothetical protein [Rhodoferax fermentans]OOV09099.1 hypothetical protein RF819_12195 [Rhodoferax fermentans]
MSTTPAKPARIISLPLRLLKAVLAGLLALLILFEEWGWEPLQRALAWVGRIPGLRWLERHIAALPPYAALALFLVPTLMLLPVKLLALWTISRGKLVLGTLVILSAKVLGTAIVARLFTLTQPALMQLPWFARAFMRWTVWKNALLARVRASWLWRLGRVIKRHVQRRWQRLVS